MPGPKKQFPAKLQLRVTPELIDRIDRIRRQVSRSRWVREAVEHCLKREEKRRTRETG
jgi:metal-responsive CopG/Arc/MetJ family transcriptional regulator